VERGNRRYSYQSLLRLFLCLFILTFATGCCYLRGYETPTDVKRWQDTEPPRLSLKEKARVYQERLESRYQMPEGLIRYRRWLEGHPEMPGYGTLADGSFFLGIYLASQALRFVATGDPEAKEQVLLSLRAMKLYAEVSGERGLLARYFSPAKPDDDRWLQSPTHPEYFWLSDVSRDQYAGYIHGLGVTLAVVSDPAIRSQIPPIAAALADHLIENELEIIDWDGERTTHGDLRGRIIGFIPNGVNALICLAIAKVAAEGAGEQKYIDFYEQLVQDGYPQITKWSHFSIFGIGNRVNDNMAYLALYPLLFLEDDREIVQKLRKGGRRTWSHVREDHNAFFSFVHAAVVGDDEPGQPPGGEGKAKGREAIFEFPDNKVVWPVDLTREEFDFPRAFLNTRKCEPKSKRAVPLYLRPRSASLWVSDPHRLVGYLKGIGNVEHTGIDYLIAYWLGRYHGFIGADE
jgi:hypothetical protein